MMRSTKKELGIVRATRQEMAMIVERIGIIINDGAMWRNPIGLRHL